MILRSIERELTLKDKLSEQTVYSSVINWPNDKGLSLQIQCSPTEWSCCFLKKLYFYGVWTTISIKNNNARKVNIILQVPKVTLPWKVVVHLWLENIFVHFDFALKLKAPANFIEEAGAVVNERAAGDDFHSRQTLVQLIHHHRLDVGQSADDEHYQLAGSFPLKDTAKEWIRSLAQFSAIQILNDLLQLWRVLSVNVLYAFEAFDHLLGECFHMIWA